VHLLSISQFRSHGLLKGDDVINVVAGANYYLNEKDTDNAKRPSVVERTVRCRQAKIGGTASAAGH